MYVLIALALIVAAGAGTAPTRVEACDLLLTPGDTARFVALTGSGRRAGNLGIWLDPAGRVTYHASWRYDSVTTVWEGHLQLGDKAPASYRLAWNMFGVEQGVDAYDHAGDSLVAVKNEVRTALRAGSELTVPVSAATPVVAALTQCLARTPGQLRPVTLIDFADTVGVREVRLRAHQATSLTLRGPAGSKTVSLYVITSDSFPAPFPAGARLWLDEAGRFFARSISEFPAEMVMRREWTGSMQQLLIAEARAAEPRMQETARALGERNARGTAFVHARVIDVETGTARDNVSLLVRRGRIIAVTPDSHARIPRGVTVVDATGKTLLPGLWDVGQHRTNGAYWATSDSFTRDLLSRGITSIQEMEADTIFTPMIARRIARGDQIGPTIIPGCLVDGWYPDTVAGAVPDRRNRFGQVRDSTALLRLIRSCYDMGARQLMLNDNLSAPLTRIAIREGKRRRMRIVGDAQIGRSTRDLIESGYDEFAHAFQALVPFFEIQTDTAAWLLHRRGGIASFWSTGAAFANLDLGHPGIRDAVDLLAQRRIALQTTFCVYPPIARGRRHDRTWDTVSFAKLQEFTLMLHRAGAPILPATDSACPLVRELGLLADIGFTPAELLRMVTVGAARSRGLYHHVGSIAPGKVADILLTEGDPLSSIADLGRVSMVMKGGMLYRKPAELRAPLPFLDVAPR